MAYIETMVAAVPTENKAAYLDYAREFGSLFKKHGALGTMDSWGNDVPQGKVTSFPLSVKCEPGETVAVGFIRWPSKAARDKAWESLMKEPKMQPGAMHMPFDGKRMIYGGFEVILEL
jgi:uncharacterized protein YbaA (DUF1428 family)